MSPARLAAPSHFLGRASRPLLIVLAALTACSAPPLPEATTDIVTASTEPDWSVFTLGPSDVVSVRVVGREEYADLAAGLRVSPQGNLAIPRIAPVPVTGLSVEQAESAIEEALRAVLKRPEVSVSLVELASRRFHALGMVGQPGPSVFDRPVTALEALAMVGGAAPGARRDRAMLIRRQGREDLEIIEFNAETPDPGGLVQLMPDDILFVPRRGVTRFQEEVAPYLQAVGLSLQQVTTVTLAVDTLNSGN